MYLWFLYGYSEANSDDDNSNRKRTTMNVTANSSFGNTSVDESSFVDNSFLNTISEKNPKYIGNKTKILKSSVLRARQTARNTKSNARRSALDDLSADDEEEENGEVVGGMDSQSDGGTDDSEAEVRVVVTTACGVCE
jgi:hypothetical protein